MDKFCKHRRLKGPTARSGWCCDKRLKVCSVAGANITRALVSHCDTEAIKLRSNGDLLAALVHNLQLDASNGFPNACR